jgi:hypothetical protein
LAHHQDQDDEESTRHVLFQSIHKNVIKKKWNLNNPLVFYYIIVHVQASVYKKKLRLGQ